MASNDLEAKHYARSTWLLGAAGRGVALDRRCRRGAEAVEPHLDQAVVHRSTKRKTNYFFPKLGRAERLMRERSWRGKDKPHSPVQKLASTVEGSSYQGPANRLTLITWPAFKTYFLNLFKNPQRLRMEINNTIFPHTKQSTIQKQQKN